MRSQLTQEEGVHPKTRLWQPIGGKCRERRGKGLGIEDSLGESQKQRRSAEGGGTNCRPALRLLNSGTTQRGTEQRGRNPFSRAGLEQVGRSSVHHGAEHLLLGKQTWGLYWWESHNKRVWRGDRSKSHAAEISSEFFLVEASISFLQSPFIAGLSSHTAGFFVLVT